MCHAANSATQPGRYLDHVIVLWLEKVTPSSESAYYEASTLLPGTTFVYNIEIPIIKIRTGRPFHVRKIRDNILASAKKLC